MFKPFFFLLSPVHSSWGEALYHDSMHNEAELDQNERNNDNSGHVTLSLWGITQAALDSDYFCPKILIIPNCICPLCYFCLHPFGDFKVICTEVGTFYLGKRKQLPHQER